MKKIKFEFKNSNEQSITAEVFLRENCKISPRSALKSAFLDGHILRDRKKLKRTDLVQAGDVITIETNHNILISQDTNPVQSQSSETLKLPILLQNNQILALNKPHGIHSHPLKSSELNTALNFAGSVDPNILIPTRKQKPLEGRLVHRLDAETSGVLLFAKSDEAFHKCVDAFRKKEMTKIYCAWVFGKIEKSIHIECAIEHSPKNKKKMILSKNESALLTQTRVLPIFTRKEPDQKTEMTFCLIQIFTGVTHQIRLVLSSLGYPIVGDPIYTSKTNHSKKMKIRTLSKNEVLQMQKRFQFEFKNNGQQLNGRMFLHCLLMESNSSYLSLYPGVFAPLDHHWNASLNFFQ